MVIIEQRKEKKRALINLARFTNYEVELELRISEERTPGCLLFRTPSQLIRQNKMFSSA